MSVMDRAMWLVTAAMTAQLVSRGLDYITGNPATGAGVFDVYDITPSLVWGLACLVTAGIVIVGAVARSLCLVRAAAVLAAAIYTTFTVMVFDDIFLRPPIDDWRFFTQYATAAFMWLIVVYVLSIRLAVLDSRADEGEGEGCGDTRAGRPDH